MAHWLFSCQNMQSAAASALSARAKNTQSIKWGWRSRLSLHHVKNLTGKFDSHVTMTFKHPKQQNICRGTWKHLREPHHQSGNIKLFLLTTGTDRNPKEYTRYLQICCTGICTVGNRGKKRQICCRYPIILINLPSFYCFSSMRGTLYPWLITVFIFLFLRNHNFTINVLW